MGRPLLPFGVATKGYSSCWFSTSECIWSKKTRVWGTFAQIFFGDSLRNFLIFFVSFFLFLPFGVACDALYLEIGKNEEAEILGSDVV